MMNNECEKVRKERERVEGKKRGETDPCGL
jgi:hypothetical protein